MENNVLMFIVATVMAGMGLLRVACILCGIGEWLGGDNKWAEKRRMARFVKRYSK